MEGRKSIFSLTALWLLACLAVGCQSQQAVHPAGEAATVYETDGPWRQADSSVLLTPEALAWMDASGIDPDATAWYSSRNDRLPYVVSGSQSVIVDETAVTYSRSHFGSFGGQVRDNSQTHTYRRRIETTVP